MSKEFEAVGFFISDHPLNQFKDVFDEYNIMIIKNLIAKMIKRNQNVAATLLKIQERKTAKGTLMQF